MNATPNRRHRPALAGLAVALVLAVSTATLGSPVARAVTLVVPSGLGQLLTTYDGAAVVRGIAEFGSVPGARRSRRSRVSASSSSRCARAAGARGRPGRVPCRPPSSMARPTTFIPTRPIQLFDTASSDAMGPALRAPPGSPARA